MENNVSKWRYVFLVLLLLSAFGLFTARLIDWQIVEGEKYGDIAKNSTTYTVESEALRGEILDINGVGLAINTTGYKIVIDKLYMDDDKLNDSILSLVEMMEKCNEKWIDNLPILADKNGGYTFAKDKEDEIASLKSKDNLNMNSYSTANECMAKLVELYDCKKYTEKQQRDIISVRYNMVKMGYSKTTPYTFADGISATTMAVISENFQDIPGIDVRSSTIRVNTNGTAAPHIVGAYGAISQEEYKEKQNEGYGLNDKIGKFGIEKSMESYLRGTPGSKMIRASSNGNVLDVVETKNAEPGNTVYLTIDARYQKLAQKALKDAVKEAKEIEDTSSNGDEEDTECTGGAVVMLNVKDFSVICAATYPNYDLSKYWSDYSDIAAKKGNPLLNKAFNSAFAPGSTFKPLVASAALEEKVITKDTTIYCKGVYDYYDGLNLHCMGYHEDTNVTKGITVSCNYFFNEVGRLLGIDAIDSYATRAGFGSATGIELGYGEETNGAIAGPENSKRWGSEWYPGNTVQAAIGQSDTLVSPIQLATYAATLANDGVRLQPHIIRKIVDYSRENVIMENDPDKPTVVDKLEISKENQKIVRDAMINAVNESYSSVFADFPIQIAGKTGTAENNSSDHANFICYAPADNPQVAIGVMIEHGKKSSVAMGVAKKLLLAYFENEGLEDIESTDIATVPVDNPSNANNSSEPASNSEPASGGDVSANNE